MSRTAIFPSTILVSAHIRSIPWEYAPVLTSTNHFGMIDVFMYDNAFRQLRMSSPHINASNRIRFANTPYYVSQGIFLTVCYNKKTTSQNSIFRFLQSKDLRLEFFTLSASLSDNIALLHFCLPDWPGSNLARKNLRLTLLSPLLLGEHCHHLSTSFCYTFSWQKSAAYQSVSVHSAWPRFLAKKFGCTATFSTGSEPDC